MEPGILAMEYRIQDCLAWIPFIHGKHGRSTYLQKIIFSIFYGEKWICGTCICSLTKLHWMTTTLFNRLNAHKKECCSCTSNSFPGHSKCTALHFSGDLKLKFFPGRPSASSYGGGLNLLLNPTCTRNHFSLMHTRVLSRIYHLGEKSRVAKSHELPSGIWGHAPGNFCIGNSMICSDIWHIYHEWYFKIVMRNFTSR